MRLLILLVGHNNIANYALINYFKNDKKFIYDKVVLIYTKGEQGTEKLAKNIIELKKEISFLEIALSDGRNLLAIQKEVSDFLSKLNISFIHFNYTGGSKPMSLGSFLAIEKLNIKTRFSDISPINYKLTFANGEIYPEKSSIIESVNISINEYAKLNGFEILNIKKDNSKFFSEEFCRFLLDKELNYKKSSEAKDFFKFWERDVNDISKENYQHTINQKIKFDLDLEDLNRLKRFINGIWLEEFLFNFLILLKEEFKLSDIGWSVEIKGKRKFELDVLVSKGYKLYVFSCTTDKYEHLKSKAFEAIHRTSQLGGINAKPILVSLAKDRNIKQLEDDLIETTGKESINFIGREEIKDKQKLKRKLMEIFK